MTIRSRPILDRRHRPRWQDEMRTQQLIIVGFALAIALALGIFGAAVWNGYWEAHLRPIAEVEGTTFTQSDGSLRAEILGAEIAAEATELNLQMVGGPRDQLLQQQIDSLTQAIQQVDATAVRSLVDGAVLRSRADAFGIQVTPDEVDAAVAERTTKPERIRARLILINALPEDAEPDAEPTDEQRAAAEEEAQAAIDRIEGGEAFADVATEVSDDFTAASGGLLGWFGEGDVLYGEYFDALADAEAADVVGPIETDEGSAVLLLEERQERTSEGGINALLDEQGISDEDYRTFVADTVLLDEFEAYFGDEVVTSPAPQRRVGQIVIQPVTGGEVVTQERARHILIQPEPELEDQSEATPQQWAFAMSKAGQVHELVSNPNADWFAIADEFSDDTGSAARGGDLGWYDPESPRFVEAFTNALADLEVGEISEPFESEFGWHVVQKTGERESPEAEAAELVDQLQEDPDSFPGVAALMSEDYTTAQEGGDLGWVARWQLDRMLEDAVFGLAEVGDISEPITDSNGAITIYQLLETSEDEEIDEDRLEQIRTNGASRWLDEEVRAPVDTWIDPEFSASTSA